MLLVDVHFSQVYGAGLMFFAASCALTGLQGFLPTIIASFGFSRHKFSPYHSLAYVH